MNEIYKHNRFNGEYYNEFLLVVEKLESETNNPIYKDLKLEIEKNFNYNKSQLNSKAKDIKNQLYNIELGK